MNIVYTIGLLAAFISGFFVALICIKVGLTWQMQIKEGKEPELHNPVDSVVKAVQQNKQDKAVNYSTEQVTEWLYGEGK
ncbi:MAG TPA: hypothetical protein VIK78_14645 [Ruminiclostridium sp.]